MYAKCRMGRLIPLYLSIIIIASERDKVNGKSPQKWGFLHFCALCFVHHNILWLLNKKQLLVLSLMVKLHKKIPHLFKAVF